MCGIYCWHFLRQVHSLPSYPCLCNAGASRRCTPRRVTQRKWTRNVTTKVSFTNELKWESGTRERAGSAAQTGLDRKCEGPQNVCYTSLHSPWLRLKWKQVNLIWKFWEHCWKGRGGAKCGWGHFNFFSQALQSLINVLPLLLRWQNNSRKASRKSSERQGNWIYVCKLMNPTDICGERARYEWREIGSYIWKMCRRAQCRK